MSQDGEALAAMQANASQITGAVASVVTDAEFAALTAPPPPTYQELRAAEYNLKSTGEQFAMQYDDQVNGTTTWIDWQDGIKAAIPKI